MPKTILQVLPSLVSGGVETGTLDLANRLVKQGYRSLVVSSGGPLVQKLVQQGSTHVQLPVHSKNPIQMWLNHKKLAQLIKEQHVDLVHVRSRAPAWSCLWASKHTKTPLVTTFHGVYGHSNALKRWYNSSMLRSRKTIAVSNFVRNHIDKTYPTFSNKVETIHRGIDLHAYDYAYDNEKAKLNTHLLRKQWQIPANCCVILLPGRLTRIKGHKILIEALAKLSNPNFYCLFIGDEPGKDGYKNELLSLIAEKGLQDKVKFTGNYHDMPSAYRLADIVVSASIKPESFGRVACEAQLMTCPVVASNHGGSQETIAPTFRDYMCKPNNADSMRKAIESVQTLSQTEKEQKGHEAARYIRENFSLDKMCRDTIALYELELSKQSLP